MPSCIICGRTENKHSKNANISFHKFPNKENVREIWVKFYKENCLNKDTCKLIGNARVCSSHFDDSCFIQHKFKRLLQKHAFPTIIISRIKSAKIFYPEVAHAIDIPVDSCITSYSSDILRCKRKLVKISTNNVENECVSPLINKPLSEVVEKNMKKSESPFLAASKIIEDTPCQIFLKHGFQQLSQEIIIKNKAIKMLKQTIRRQTKKLENLKTILNNVINEDTSCTLLKS